MITFRFVVVLAWFLYRGSARRVQTIAERSDEQQANSNSNISRRLQPFPRGLPDAVLQNAVEIDRALMRGEVWTSKQTIDKHTAIARAAMNIKASTSTVWQQLTDFSGVKEKFPAVIMCDVYRRLRKEHVEQVFVKYVSKAFPGIKMTYHLVYTFEERKHSVTWSLDEEKKNDFEDLQGHWHLEVHPQDSSHTRAFCEIGLVLPGWLPQYVKDKLAEKSVDEISWLKRHSEKAEGSSEEIITPKMLTTFSAGRPKIVIGSSDESLLAEGKVSRSAKLYKNGFKGHAIMNVEAPQMIVWSQLAGFASYPNKAAMVQSCEVYKRSFNKRFVFVGRFVERISVKFVLDVLGHKIVYHVLYSYHPKLKSLTWTLDGKRENDLDAFEGHWHVESHSESQTRSRVFLEMGLVLPSSLPSRVVDRLTKHAIEEWASWLKRESEWAAVSTPQSLLPNWRPQNDSSQL